MNTEKITDLTGLSCEQLTLLSQLLADEGVELVQQPQLPVLVPDVTRRYEPFPLNDMQQAYWIGRTDSFEMGNISIHLYTEIDIVDLDVTRLQQAWQKLLERHDMLRAVVLADGKQQILEQVPPYTIKIVDLRGKDPDVTESQLTAVRDRLSHQVLPLETWPQFEIVGYRLDKQHTRLCMSLDGWCMDGGSYQILFRELQQLYAEPETILPPLELSFRDYVLALVALENTPTYEKSLDYWRRRIPDLPPPPELPLATNPATLSQPRFVSLTYTIKSATLEKLMNRATKAGLTLSSTLLTVYVEVLRLWSQNPKFTINVPRFNRLPLHPQVNSIIGELASFTLLEVDCSQQEAFVTRAQRIQAQLWQDLEYDYVSGVRVLRELAKFKGQIGGATMPIVFTTTAQQELKDTNTVGTALGEIVYSLSKTPQVWIDNLYYLGDDGSLTYTWHFVEDIFPPGMVNDMFKAACDLLQMLAEQETAWQQTKRQLITPAHLEQRAAVNHQVEAIAEVPIQTLFTTQVTQRPQQTAIVTPERAFTYAELFQQSHRLGHRLRGLGACPNTLVAIVMDKGWEQIVSVLGIVVSGAAYLPIDPELPQERLWYLLENGAVSIVLTQSKLHQQIAWPAGIQTICVDTAELAAEIPPPLEPIQKPDDLLYVIYTSGSTGLPKGVMINHRGAVNAIAQTNQHFHISSQDKVLALTALHHDMSVYDIFGILAAGGTIVIPDAAAKRDPAHWVELMRQEKITIWNSVPAMMEMLLEYVGDRAELLPPTWRWAFLGGDWINITIPHKLKTLGSSVQIVSVGGPTETTLWNIWYVVETLNDSQTSIPYGKPIANTQYYIFNPALEDCPIWVTGELYCSGVGIAKGYWRNPEKTQSSFITHHRTGERLYRTGDLGRYLPDGNIEFCGRMDFQVKIRGHRIELREIEAALMQYPGMKNVVVTAVGGKTQNKERLIAYIVPDKQLQDKNDCELADQLRTFLKQKLPEYMLPTTFIILESLPLTANGKVDRLALPIFPDESPNQNHGYVKPQTPTEKLLTDIWQEILQKPSLGIYDNFFALGGNSLQATQVISLVRSRCRVELPMKLLFAQPTVADIAQEIDKISVNQTQREIYNGLCLREEGEI